MELEILWFCHEGQQTVLGAQREKLFKESEKLKLNGLGASLRHDFAYCSEWLCQEPGPAARSAARSSW